MGGTEVIELSSGQRQDGHTQGSEVGVIDFGFITQRAPEVGIEVVIDDLAVACGFLAQQPQRTFREEPYPDVGQIKMILEQPAEHLDRWFLHHPLQARR